MFKRLSLSFSVGLLLYSSSLFAQTQNATLLGIVSDGSGAVINGAEVTLQEPKTGQTVRSAKSNESGSFQFDELKPGTYELRCVAPSFKIFVARDVVLDSGQVRRLDPQLVLGATVEQVTVNAGAAVINTESATISDPVYCKRARSVPAGYDLPEHVVSADDLGRHPGRYLPTGSRRGAGISTDPDLRRYTQ